MSDIIKAIVKENKWKTGLSFFYWKHLGDADYNIGKSYKIKHLQTCRSLILPIDVKPNMSQYSGLILIDSIVLRIIRRAGKTLNGKTHKITDFIKFKLCEDRQIQSMLDSRDTKWIASLLQLRFQELIYQLLFDSSLDFHEVAKWRGFYYVIVSKTKKITWKLLNYFEFKRFLYERAVILRRNKRLVFKIGI